MAAPLARRPYKPSKRGPMHTVPMEWEHCERLAAYMSHCDQEECISLGVTPLQALSSGCLTGWATAVIRTRYEQCVGAFGCNALHGTVWSLWGNLTRSESAQVLMETPAWIDKMVTRCGGHRPLTNFVSVDNQRAIDWLETTGCFVLDRDPLFVGPKMQRAYAFRTKAGMHYVS